MVAAAAPSVSLVRHIASWWEILLLVLLAISGTSGLALVDIATQGFRDGATMLCNGYWCWSTDKVFHAALYAAYGAVWGLCFLVLASFRRR